MERARPLDAAPAGRKRGGEKGGRDGFHIVDCIARKRGGCSEQKKSFNIDAILAIARGASSVTYFLPQGGKLSVRKIAHLYIRSGRYRYALLRCMEVEIWGEDRSEDPFFVIATKVNS